MAAVKVQDAYFMKQALKLALKGTGYVSPNPRVGAIIVKDGKIIGRGWHKIYGGNHAEVEAIKDAGIDDFSGCAMYVTLEPCSHYGKTPPCAGLLVQKKFKKVVIGAIDINPAVSGDGISILKKAGIEVVRGVMEKECRRVNRFFFKRAITGMPYVTLKTAQSIDGCIASYSGESQWITSFESRKTGHALRAENDAILVGKKTVEEDNPSLNVRHIKGRNPMRIVLDTKLELPHHLKIFNDEERERTLVACSSLAYSSERRRLLEKKGVNLIDVSVGDDGRLNLKNLFSVLAKEYEISSILSEGGASVNSYLIENKLADELRFFIEPMIIGDGKSSYGCFHPTSLNAAPHFDIYRIIKSGTGFQVIMLPKNPNQS